MESDKNQNQWRFYILTKDTKPWEESTGDHFKKVAQKHIEPKSSRATTITWNKKSYGCLKKQSRGKRQPACKN